MKKKKHKRYVIRKEKCDKNVIRRENSNVKMRTWKRKNMWDERLV